MGAFFFEYFLTKNKKIFLQSNCFTNKKNITFCVNKIDCSFY
jgi:hypothetical protein